MKTRILIALVLSLFGTACGPKKIGTSDEALAQGAGLNGVFQQACLALGTYSSSSTLAYSGGVQTGATTVFMDATCMSAGYSYTIAGPYQVGGPADSPSGANKLNVTLQSMTLVPLSAAGVTALNTNSFCGLTNWTLNTPQNISGRNCGGRTYTAGQTVHTIFSLSGDTLLMGQVALPGNPGDGTSDTNRPTMLGQPFVRF